MTCSIDGCDRDVYGRGWCNMHYQRWKRNGDPEIQHRFRGDPIGSFWAKVNKTPTCWLWTAGLTRLGYGALRSYGDTVSAHRFSYEMLVGPIPAGLDLDHLCRNRACVNPDHLEPVTHRENVLRGSSFIAQQATMTECHRGHPFDAGNTYIIPSTGSRQCKQCDKEYRLANRDHINARRRDRRAAQRRR